VLDAQFRNTGLTAQPISKRSFLCTQVLRVYKFSSRMIEARLIINPLEAKCGAVSEQMEL
jgi:hypothetical protein